MNDLRKAAQDVLDAQAMILHLQNTTGACLYAHENLDSAIEALRAALAETPSVDALIAEIDGLEVQAFEISRHPWIEEAYHKDDIKAILDKYRARGGA